MRLKLKHFKLGDGAGANCYLGFGDICPGYMSVQKIWEDDKGMWVRLNPYNGKSSVINVPRGMCSEIAYEEVPEAEQPPSKEQKDAAKQEPIAGRTGQPNGRDGQLVEEVRQKSGAGTCDKGKTPKRRGRPPKAKLAK